MAGTAGSPCLSHLALPIPDLRDASRSRWPQRRPLSARVPRLHTAQRVAGDAKALDGSVVLDKLPRDGAHSRCRHGGGQKHTPACFLRPTDLESVVAYDCRGTNVAMAPAVAEAAVGSASTLTRLMERGEKVSVPLLVESLNRFRHIDFASPCSDRLLPTLAQVLRIARDCLSEANGERQSLEVEFAMMHKECERLDMGVEDCCENLRRAEDRARQRMQDQMELRRRMQQRAAELTQEIDEMRQQNASMQHQVEFGVTAAREAWQQEWDDLEERVTKYKQTLQELEVRFDVGERMRVAQEKLRVERARYEELKPGKRRHDELQAMIRDRQVKINELTAQLQKLQGDDKEKTRSRKKKGTARIGKASPPSASHPKMPKSTGSTGQPPWGAPSKSAADSTAGNVPSQSAPPMPPTSIRSEQLGDEKESAPASSAETDGQAVVGGMFGVSPPSNDIELPAGGNVTGWSRGNTGESFISFRLDSAGVGEVNDEGAVGVNPGGDTTSMQANLLPAVVHAGDAVQ